LPPHRKTLGSVIGSLLRKAVVRRATQAAEVTGSVVRVDDGLIARI